MIWYDYNNQNVSDTHKRIGFHTDRVHPHTQQSESSPHLHYKIFYRQQATLVENVIEIIFGSARFRVSCPDSVLGIKTVEKILNQICGFSIKPWAVYSKG